MLDAFGAIHVLTKSGPHGITYPYGQADVIGGWGRGGGRVLSRVFQKNVRKDFQNDVQKDLQNHSHNLSKGLTHRY